MVTDGWDVLCGAIRPRGKVLFYDDNGGHPGMDAAEVVARSGVEVEFVTPERTLAPDVGGVNYPGYFKAFAEHDVRVTLNERVTGVRRKDGRLEVDLYNEYAHATKQRLVDQVVVEHGTLPQDELYFDLVARFVEPRRGRSAGPARPAPTAGRPQLRGRLPTVPDRRRGREPQHPRRDLRRLPALHRPVTRFVTTIFDSKEFFYATTCSRCDRPRQGRAGRGRDDHDP